MDSGYDDCERVGLGSQRRIRSTFYFKEKVGEETFAGVALSSQAVSWTWTHARGAAQVHCCHRIQPVHIG